MGRKTNKSYYDMTETSKDMHDEAVRRMMVYLIRTHCRGTNCYQTLRRVFHAKQRSEHDLISSFCARAESVARPG